MTQHSLSYPQMLEVFMADGQVTSDSPKNRRDLYRHLKSRDIQFTTKIVGYTLGQRSLCRWAAYKAMRWNTKVLAKWIDAGRILADDVRQNTDGYPYDDYEFSDVEPAFADGLTRDEREAILKQAWNGALSDPDVKWTPFDRCTLRKTIVHISRLSNIE